MNTRYSTACAARRAAFGLSLVCAAAGAAEWDTTRLYAFTEASCRSWEATSAPAAGFAQGPVGSTDLRFGETPVGRRFSVPLEDEALVELDVIERSGRALRFVASWYSGFGDPQALISLDSDCSL